MERLNERIQEVSAKRARRARIEALLERADKDLDAQQERLAELRARFEKEEQDVAQLEGLSLTALFHTILSSKQEQLKKEKQELLQATLRYDECQAATTELEQQIAGLRSELDGLVGVEAEYSELLTQKEALLTRSADGRGRVVLDLSARIGEEDEQLRELGEALACGNDVHLALERVVDSLQSAQNWGTFDLLGGGLIVTAIKHSKIDAGRKAAHEAQSHMRRFRSELADVRMRSEVSIDIGGFSSFADYFFDGLIFDWVVQSKIAKSLEGAIHARQRIDETVAGLRDLHLVTERRIAELEEARRTAIEQA